MSKTTEQLIQNLNSTDRNVREDAMRALAYIGEAAVPLLVDAVRENTVSPTLVGETLSQIGRLALDPLSDLLQVDEKDVQLRATIALSRMKDNLTVIPLIVALNDNDDEVKIAAAAALGSFNDVRAVGPLLKAMQDPSTDVQARAARSLGSYQDDRVPDVLLAALRDAHIDVRCGAIWALAHFPEPRVKAALEEALADPNGEVRQLAAAALRELDGDSLALERLAASDNDASAEIQSILSHMEGGDIERFETDALRHSNPRIRARLLEVLGDKGGEYAVTAILPSLNDINPAVRSTGVQSLIKLGQVAVVPLIAALENKSKYVRAGSAEVLGQLRDARAVDPLIGLLKDREAMVRSSAVEALALLGDARAEGPLRDVLTDKDEKVRNLAERALTQWGHNPNQSDNLISKMFRRFFDKK